MLNVAPKLELILTDIKKNRFYNSFQLGTLNECWNWKAYTSKKYGYGIFWLQGKLRRAHRVSYMIHNGTVPEGIFVCHTCDNRKCVNPNHLWLGTNKENAIDMVKKGRGKTPNIRGESQWMTKLTEEQAIDIINRGKNKENQKNIAKEYGISPSCVSQIVTGITWKHLSR